MNKDKVLLYGANGYTGELIARYAGDYNVQPILAGRREEAIKPLAEKLKLEYRLAPLEPAALAAVLQDVKVVIHTAGPFDITAKPMVDACLATGTHYLDINGDLEVFKMLQQYDERAKKAGIMIISGVGFDVVPTDCLALFLKKQLPDAIYLKLAFATPGGGLSHGTAITTVRKLGEPGAVRSYGLIKPVPVGHKSMTVDFGKQQLFVATIPWGDVYTAYVTTGIPNIESYTTVPKAAYYLFKGQKLFNWILKTGGVRNLLQKIVDKRPAGLVDDKRDKSSTLVWGQVSNRKGEKVTARQYGPDAYTLTAFTSLLITQKVLQGEIKPGYQTPAGAYGENLVMEIQGITRETV